VQDAIQTYPALGMLGHPAATTTDHPPAQQGTAVTALVVRGPDHAPIIRRAVTTSPLYATWDGKRTIMRASARISFGGRKVRGNVCVDSGVFVFTPYDPDSVSPEQADT
jgi:hypothetical protein